MHLSHVFHLHRAPQLDYNNTCVDEAECQAQTIRKVRSRGRAVAELHRRSKQEGVDEPAWLRRFETKDPLSVHLVWLASQESA